MIISQGHIEKLLPLLQQITGPYANGPEHVQGPGGNTSVKDDLGNMIIKASGYLFKDVAENREGIVSLNLQSVIGQVQRKFIEQNTDVNTVQITGSIPADSTCKPSMEYEFHSLLGKYVLHTHSVYSNIVSCSDNVKTLYANILNDIEHLVIPYVTPGYPIASFIYNYRLQHSSIPSVIFLTNHGIIVHGDEAAKVIDLYNTIEYRIRQLLALDKLNAIELAGIGDHFVINVKDIYGHFDAKEAMQILEENILFPDQTIFFRNKLSFDLAAGSPITIDVANNQVIIKGTKKFAAACAEMIQAVQYVQENHKKLGKTSVYLAADEINVLHGLSSEKYRSALLNKKD